MFARKIEKTLVNYYQNKSDKILYIYGARQIGKTYIITNTAKDYFENVVEINFRQDINSAQIYKTVKNTEDFYLQLSALYGNLLGNYNDTLIVLDDIQVYPHLLPLLSDFCIDKKYRFIACGAIPNSSLESLFVNTLERALLLLPLKVPILAFIVIGSIVGRFSSHILQA